MAPDTMGVSAILPVFNFATSPLVDPKPATGLLASFPSGSRIVGVSDPLPCGIYSPGSGPAEIAQADSDLNFAKALLGVQVNARHAFLDEATDNYVRLSGLKDDFGFAYVVEPRESAFVASQRGRRFAVTHQTPGTTITGQTAFNVNTPTFFLQRSASAKKIVLRSITLFLVVAGGGVPRIIVSISNTDGTPISVPGTNHTPQNMNSGSSVPSNVTVFRTGATITGGTPRHIFSAVIPNTVGTSISIMFKDGLLLDNTAFLAVYTFAATTGPQWFFNFEWEEK